MENLLKQSLYYKILILTTIFLYTPLFSLAEESTEKLIDTPPLVTINSDLIHKKEKTIDLFLKTDYRFSVFNPIDQGFSLKSLRFGVTGEIEKILKYRLSLATTREFSSALLPQLLPEEASVTFGENSISGKFGIFAPFINPAFSVELLDSSFPTFSLLHEELLIKRDIGAELKCKLYGINFTLGAFNGSGITNLNNSNSRAYTVSLSPLFKLENHSIKPGFSAYVLNQGDKEDGNYVNNIIGNLFLEWFTENIIAYGDLIYGSLSNNLESLSVVGSSIFVNTIVYEFISIFLRAEFIKSYPKNTQSLEHYQAGTVFYISNYIKTFIYWDMLNSTNSINMVLRVSI